MMPMNNVRLNRDGVEIIDDRDRLLPQLVRQLSEHWAVHDRSVASLQQSHRHIAHVNLRAGSSGEAQVGDQNSHSDFGFGVIPEGVGQRFHMLAESNYLRITAGCNLPLTMNFVKRPGAREGPALPVTSYRSQTFDLERIKRHHLG